MAFAEQGPYRCPISRRGLPKGCQDRADQGLQSSFQAEPGLWIRTTPYHPGPATTVFGTVVRLEDSDNSGSRKPRSEAVFAEGVGLEPTSPFGQRFSSYEHSVLTLPE